MVPPLGYNCCVSHSNWLKLFECLGRGGGQVVSMLAFYCANSSSNPTEAYMQFLSVKAVWKSENKQKEAEVGPFYFLNWAVPGPFLFIFVFSIHLTQKEHIKFADDWIRTSDLWCWKRPLYRLSHNNCPFSHCATHPVRKRWPAWRAGWAKQFSCWNESCGQSYQHFMLVIYDSRVVPDWKIPHIMTLAS